MATTAPPLEGIADLATLAQIPMSGFSSISLPLQPGMELRADRGIHYGHRIDPQGRFLVWELGGDGSIPIVRDGCLDWVFDGSGEEEPLVMGLMEEPTEVNLGFGKRWFGIRFFPGWFAAFTGADLTCWPQSPISSKELPAFQRMGAAEGIIKSSIETALDDLFQRVARHFELLARVPAADVRQALGSGSTPLTLPVGDRQLRRIFRQQTGYSWRSLTKIQRAHRSARLLLRGQSISGVAHALGYSDQAHLTRQFSEVFGFGPARMSETFKKFHAFRGRVTSL